MSTPRLHKPAFGVQLSLWLAFICACNGSTRPSDYGQGVSPQWVVESLQGSLGPDGLFLPDSLSFNPDSGINASQAEQLAVEYGQSLRTRVGNIVPVLESEHGGPIVFELLQRCGQSIYSKSAFRTPDLDAPPNLKNVLGGQFLVTLCVRETPTLFFVIAARTPAIRGSQLGFTNDLFIKGIPLQRPIFLRSAEGAVKLMFAEFGVRIDSVPRSAIDIYGVGPIGSGRPFGILWRLHLAKPTAIRRLAGGTRDTVNVIYAVAGFSERADLVLLAPADSQVEPFFVRSREGASPDSILVVPTEPTLFDEVAGVP